MFSGTRVFISSAERSIKCLVERRNVWVFNSLYGSVKMFPGNECNAASLLYVTRLASCLVVHEFTYIYIFSTFRYKKKWVFNSVKRLQDPYLVQWPRVYEYVAVVWTLFYTFIGRTPTKRVYYSGENVFSAMFPEMSESSCCFCLFFYRSEAASTGRVWRRLESYLIATWREGGREGRNEGDGEEW